MTTEVILGLLVTLFFLSTLFMQLWWGCKYEELQQYNNRLREDNEFLTDQLSRLRIMHADAQNKLWRLIGDPNHKGQQ